MRKIILFAVVIVISLLFVSNFSFAMDYKNQRVGIATPHQDITQVDKKEKVTASDFPEKGWHKGPYIAVNIGMVQATNDKHAITGQSFDGTFDPNFGLTAGWDIADWIGPMLQINLGTTTGDAGDWANSIANPAGSLLTYTAQPGHYFKRGTFEFERGAREYAINIGLYAKATLPYFTSASWQWKNLKIIPYAKLGVIGSALFVKTQLSPNNVGAMGAGPSLGAGCEFFIWKGFFAGLDLTESFIFQMKRTKIINLYDDLTNSPTPESIAITNGGMHAQFQLNGMFGWHF